MEVKPTPTVYSYYLPEVRAIVDKVRKDLYFHDDYLKNYSPGLDKAHWPLITAYEDFARKNGVIGLPGYRRYFTNGSSEAIFHLLAQHRAEHPEMPIYSLEGEYQGYKEYAKSLGLHIDEFDSAYPDMRPGLYIISQPSARSGNLLSNAFMRCLSKDHEVILDLAYLGMTRPLDIDLRTLNLRAVVGSLSKPFGLYYHRIGFCFSKVDIPSLAGQIWFKNLFSIKIGQAVLEQLNHQDVLIKYKPLQEQIVARVCDELGIIIRPSDVWLLAHTVRSRTNQDEEFRRGSFGRYCLTPYFMEKELAYAT